MVPAALPDLFLGVDSSSLHSEVISKQLKFLLELNIKEVVLDCATLGRFAFCRMVESFRLEKTLKIESSSFLRQ